jgi:hypothetical protein
LPKGALGFLGMSVLKLPLWSIKINLCAINQKNKFTKAMEFTEKNLQHENQPSIINPSVDEPLINPELNLNHLPILETTQITNQEI